MKDEFVMHKDIVRVNLGDQLAAERRRLLTLVLRTSSPDTQPWYALAQTQHVATYPQALQSRFHELFSARSSSSSLTPAALARRLAKRRTPTLAKSPLSAQTKRRVVDSSITLLPSYATHFKAPVRTQLKTKMYAFFETYETGQALTNCKPVYLSAGLLRGQQGVVATAPICSGDVIGVLEGFGWSEDEFSKLYADGNCLADQKDKDRYCFGLALPSGHSIALDTQFGEGGSINDFRSCVAW
jgi:hypothetical protein